MPQKKRKAQKPKKKKPQKKDEDEDEKKVDSEDLCATEEVKLDDEGLEIDPATSFPKNFKFSHLVSRNNTEGKGFGLVAKKHILEGEIIFQEFPLFTQQLLSNEKEGAACCAFCLRALGTPLDSLNGYVPDNVLSRIRLLPYQNQIYSVPVAEYCKKCLAIYCSANCRQLDAQRGHGLMCFTEEETEDNSFGKLRNACLTMENHLPILFGRMLSLCIHRAKESHLGVGSENGEDGASLEELVSKEWDKYFSGFCYHEETVSDEILNIYKQMVEYLRDIFQDYLQPDSKFLQVQFFKDTLDMLNVNQQLIVPRSPFDQYWNALSPEQENAPRAQKILGTVLEHLEKNRIIQVEYGRGSGILPVHHNLNHSCEPNAKVATINVDATLSVFALRDISEGEEICFDYVDTDNLSFTERQEKLLKCFYFHCLCPKCKREDSNSISNE